MSKWNFLRDYAPGTRMEVHYNIPVTSSSVPRAQTLVFRGVTDSGVILCINEKGEGVCVDPDSIYKIELRGDFIDYLAPMVGSNISTHNGNSLHGGVIK